LSDGGSGSLRAAQNGFRQVSPLLSCWALSTVRFRGYSGLCITIQRDRLKPYRVIHFGEYSLGPGLLIRLSYFRLDWWYQSSHSLYGLLESVPATKHFGAIHLILWLCLVCSFWHSVLLSLVRLLWDAGLMCHYLSHRRNSFVGPGCAGTHGWQVPP